MCSTVKWPHEGFTSTFETNLSMFMCVEFSPWKYPFGDIMWYSIFLHVRDPQEKEHNTEILSLLHDAVHQHLLGTLTYSGNRINAWLVGKWSHPQNEWNGMGKDTQVWWKSVETINQVAMGKFSPANIQIDSPNIIIINTRVTTHCRSSTEPRYKPPGQFGDFPVASQWLDGTRW